MAGKILCLWRERGVQAVDWDTAAGELAARDPALGNLIERIGGHQFPPGGRESPFEALCRSITSQQLSGKAAATIFGRFRALYPGDGFPVPEAVLDTPHADMRAAGLSEAKARAIRDLAGHATRGTIPSIDELRRMPAEEVIERLTVVRGVGRWTVEMLLLFRLGHPDVLPVHDLVIRKGIARLMRRRELPDPEQAIRRGERWRPYRSVASWYLWRAADLPQARSRSRSR
jgi:3-methyladenine DNA glycosylase/8-oxoguanine DNA glycosylase